MIKCFRNVLNTMSTRGQEYILLDDDMALTMSWELEACQAGVDLITFNTVKEFKAVAEQLKKDAVLCIDLHLSEKNLSGLDVAEWCYQNGFKYIYIVTGDELFKQKEFPWLIGIIDKYPPFSDSNN